MKAKIITLILLLASTAQATTITIGSAQAAYNQPATVTISSDQGIQGLALSLDTTATITNVKNRKFDALEWRRIGTRTMIAAASSKAVSGRLMDLRVKGKAGKHTITAKQSAIRNQWAGYPKRGEAIPIAYGASGSKPAILVAGALEVAEQTCPAIRWLLLSAKPNPVPKGDMVTLAWRVDGADRVGISDGVFGYGSYKPVGSVSYKINADITYQLSARNDCGTSNKSIAVACASTPPPVEPPDPPEPPVEPPPPEDPPCKVAPGIRSFTADKTMIKAGESVTLSWEVVGADKTHVLGVGEVEPTGTAKVSPNERTRYLMTVENECGQAYGQVWINVESVAPPPPPEESEADRRCQEAIEALQRLRDAGKCDDAYELYKELLPIIKGD